MISSAILPLHPTWTGCDNRNCGDQSRCFDCEGCRNWQAEKKLERLEKDPVISSDDLIVLLAAQIKAAVPQTRLQASEVRRISVKLLGELEKLNKA
jgi:hypothetical protein